ncbi:MAG: hypothetical protein M1282_10790 [Chloroflexi bacterium]|nr:hypothetical protein [Chloroflexota bacterium]
MTRVLDDLLRKTLPEPRLDLIRRVADEASALKMPIYIVGGFVRDLVLGRDGLDFDLVVEGNAIALAHSLASKYGGKVTAHEKFGTAKIDIREWMLESSKANEDYSLVSIDLISSRSETYKHPAALPTVKMGSIEDDIRRRDFTINTLAVRLDGPHFGELRDDLSGLDDLEKKIIRVLHERSFIDDPTRMYRAVRYEQRYGFKIADETLALIPEARALVDKLSAQRIRHELDLILEEPNVASLLARLAELDLLKPIHAALSFDDAARQRLDKANFSPDYSVQHLTPANLRWLLWLITLSEKQIESVNKRLHFTSILYNALAASSNLLFSLSSFVDLKPSQCVTQLDEFPPFSIYAVSLAAPTGKSKENLEKYLTEWRHIKPKTTGHDLKKLGIEPGPKYQEILWTLRAAWLDGKVANGQEEESLLKSIL